MPNFFFFGQVYGLAMTAKSNSVVLITQHSVTVISQRRQCSRDTLYSADITQ